MKRGSVLLTIILWLSNAGTLIAAADNGTVGQVTEKESVAQESDRVPGAAEPIKGKVEVLDSNKPGTRPRLLRPALDPKLASSRLSDPLQNNDALKARVFQAAGLGSLRPMTPQGDRPANFGAYALSAQEVKQLSKYDISVLIDRSGSMSRRDCDPLNIFDMGGKISRWEWCKQQTTILTHQIADAFPAGITVNAFASFCERYTNVSPDTINKIFNERMPSGGTRLDEALDMELESYFRERASGTRKKPLLIAVITDGVPSCPEQVYYEVVEASHHIHPGDVRIEFFLIGDAYRGSNFVNYISNIRVNAGAPFELVTDHPFAEVSELGLPRCLVRSVISSNR